MGVACVAMGVMSSEAGRSDGSKLTVMQLSPHQLVERCRSLLDDRGTCPH